MFKGLTGAALGILLSTVGTAPICGTPRFTFGSYYFAGGFSLICVMMGIFAGRIIIMEYARGEKLAGSGDKADIRVGGFKLPLRDIASNLKNIFVSFFIGLWIGFLPGMGAALSNVVAYAVARSSSRHPEQFGKGCIDGVFAPEVANNASIGGALIPAIALGIPGDTATALMLGGLTPTLATLKMVKEELPLKVIAMVRPRGAGFCYSREDFQVMKAEARALLEHGADGIAFGCLNENG